MPSRNAFTLIELLVVIAIIGILGIGVFVNFKDFAQEQFLNRAISDIQTLIREAQANSTTSLLCKDQSGVDWAVNFQTNREKIDLICGANISVKTLSLVNIQVQSIKGSACLSGGDLPLTITFSKLSGRVKFEGSDTCINSSKTVLINLKNLKTNNIKGFTVSRGGATDAK